MKISIPHIKKIGTIMRKYGEHLSNKNRPHKIMPLFIENEQLVMERKQIVHSHDIFENEKNHTYNTEYMNKMYTLLFENEKKYYLERNKMILNQRQYPKKKPTVKVEEIIKPIVKNIKRPIIYHRNINNNDSFHHYRYKSFSNSDNTNKDEDINISKVVFNKNDRKQKKRIEKKYKCLSFDSNKMFDMINENNIKCEMYRTSLKQQVNRRLYHYFQYDYAIWPTPIKMEETKSSFYRTEGTNTRYYNTTGDYKNSKMSFKFKMTK